MFDVLDDSNFLLFAAKNYDNDRMDQEEFEEDLQRIKYIKRLFRKYKDGKELRERLILNHLIILYNVFHPPACTRMLAMKLNEYVDCLKPFLSYLNYWPNEIEPVLIKKDQHWEMVEDDVKGDQNIVNALRNL